MTPDDPAAELAALDAARSQARQELAVAALPVFFSLLGYWALRRRLRDLRRAVEEHKLAGPAEHLIPVLVPPYELEMEPGSENTALLLYEGQPITALIGVDRTPPEFLAGIIADHQRRLAELADDD